MAVDRNAFYRTAPDLSRRRAAQPRRLWPAIPEREIEIEGSADGVEWRAYRWRYKPDALTERPRWIAPFQPRLDWQMWFAALGTWEEERWFQAFCQKLLNGSPAVVRLLAHNPFPDAPPRFLRATLYRYRFAPSGTGRWWTRERVRDYSPVLERGAL